MIPLVMRNTICSLKVLISALYESGADVITVLSFGQKSKDIDLWQKLASATYYEGSE